MLLIMHPNSVLVPPNNVLYSSCLQVTFQYSFWDRFKLLSTSSPQSLENLAKLIAHLFASNGLSIAILKVGISCIFSALSECFFALKIYC